MNRLSVFRSRFSATDRRRLKSGPATGNCSLTAARAGFTILELLCVFVIIAALAGAILGVTRYAATNAAVSRAKAEIAAMETALESYKNDKGAYPRSTLNRLSGPPLYVNEQRNNALLYSALVDGKYMTFKPSQIQALSATQTNIIDPFGTPYNYYCRVPPPINQTNQATFDLWSYGPDRMDSTPDDIVNWRR
jgi:general secretion pathway protein G